MVELGAGPGLAGLLAARLGAHVTITDKAGVLPLIRENAALNGAGPVPTTACPGTAEVRVSVCMRHVLSSWLLPAAEPCLRKREAQV